MRGYRECLKEDFYTRHLDNQQACEQVRSGGQLDLVFEELLECEQGDIL